MAVGQQSLCAIGAAGEIRLEGSPATVQGKRVRVLVNCLPLSRQYAAVPLAVVGVEDLLRQAAGVDRPALYIKPRRASVWRGFHMGSPCLAIPSPAISQPRNTVSA